jgi:hypothetical protein
MKSTNNAVILTDMGFSLAEARHALSLFPTVDEAAEHLLANGAMAQADAQEEPEQQNEVCISYNSAFSSTFSR